MKVKELIEVVNDDIIYSLDELFNTLTQRISNNRGKSMSAEEYTEIKRIENVKVEYHKYYVKAVDVYYCEDGYVGITGVKRIYNLPLEKDTESAARLLGIACSAKVYAAVPDTTYVPWEQSPYVNETA